MVASLEDRINKGMRNKKGGKGELPKIPTGPRGGISKNRTNDHRGSNSKPSNIDGKWKHDLFVGKSKAGKDTKGKPGSAPPSLESRISKVSTKGIPASVAKSLASNKLFAALHGGALTLMEKEKAAKTADSVGASIRGISKDSKKQQSQPSTGHGFSIRGSAGPFAVHASNFAPGTTASDIRVAMEGLGRIVNCAVTSASPTVIAEIVFEKKEDADTCIRMYNNKKADGYLLHMFFKDSPSIPINKGGSNTQKESNPASASIRRGGGGGGGGRGRGDIYTPPQRQQGSSNNYVDGTLGFQPPKLYSDALVQKGRGFNR